MRVEIGGELIPGDLIAVTGYRSINLAIYIREGKKTAQFYEFGVLENMILRCERLEMPLKLWNKSYCMRPETNVIKLTLENLNFEQIELYMKYKQLLKDLKAL